MKASRIMAGVFLGILAFAFVMAQTGRPVKTGIQKILPNEIDNPDLVPVAQPLPKMSLPPESEKSRSVLTPGDSFTGPGSPDGAPSDTGQTNGKDVVVSAGLNNTYNGDRVNSDIVSDWRGRLYCISQVYYNPYSHWFIQLFRSVDYGKTWATWGFVQSLSVNLTEPSLSIGKGSTNGYKLVMAYIVGASPSYIEVATQDINDDSFHGLVTHSLAHFANPYAHPKIWTDYDYSGDWRTYLVAEWQFDAANHNIDIEYWRSTDGGGTWPSSTADYDDHQILYGEYDSYEWTQPDGEMGHGDDQYVAVYNKTDKTIHEMKISYPTSAIALTDRAVYTLPADPTNPVNPSIAANYNVPTQIITFTQFHKIGDDDILYLRSLDDGATWGGAYALLASSHTEFGAKVKANPGASGRFHAVANYDNFNVVYLSRGLATTAGGWSPSRTINDTAGGASADYPLKGIFPIISTDFPCMTWSEQGSPYQIYFDRGYSADLVATWDGQGVFIRNSDSGLFTSLSTPATQIAVGDLDADGTDDLLGIWPSQGGVWLKNSSTGAWTQLSSTADWITAADINGDYYPELLGTWAGQGVYWRNRSTGLWTQLATPATQITAGDLDYDWIADLIGIWPSQGGVWVKYSTTGTWANLASTADWIGTGDMNGDRYDELIGSWAGQGVFWRDNSSGAWTLLATPATMIGAGDLDGDGTDDLLGVWPSQGGVWVKYSTTGAWAYLGTTPRWIASGHMRGGSHPWTAGVAGSPQPVGGAGSIPAGMSLASQGPGGFNFSPKVEKNLVPSASRFDRRTTPGPGMPGFVYVTSSKPVPEAAKAEKKTERHHR